MVIRNNSIRTNQENELTPAERFLITKKKRQLQLKKYFQNEKDFEKEKQKLKKKQSENIKTTQNKNISFHNNAILLDAVSRNDIDEVQKLLNLGISPNACNDDGTTALHQCCIDNYEEMLKLLIERNANVNAVDQELWTPLHVAATCGYMQLCKILIHKGSNLLALNCDGLMPYDICDNNATLDLIENEMSRRGITQLVIDEKRQSPEKLMLSELKGLFKENKSLEFKGRNGETPLHIAASNGYLEVISYLLSQKSVHINSLDNDAWQPIHCSTKWNQLEAVEILLRHGADLNAKTKFGSSALDLCEDSEVKSKINEIRDQLAKNGLVKTLNLPKRHNSIRSSSVRRASLRDKKALSIKDAKDEGMVLLNSSEALNISDEQDESTDDYIEKSTRSTSVIYEQNGSWLTHQTSETSLKSDHNNGVIHNNANLKLQSVLKRTVPSKEKQKSCCIIS